MTTGIPVRTDILDATHALLREGITQEELDAALFQVRDWLRDQRRFLTPAQWEDLREHTVHHPLSVKLRTLCPLTDRAFSKPCGYPGDAVTMDLLYGMHDDVPTDGLAGAVYSFTYRLPVFVAARYRRVHCGERADAAAAVHFGGTGAAVGAGHLREVNESVSIRNGSFPRYLAVDQDRESLKVAEREYSQYGVTGVPMGVRDIMRAGRLPETVHFISCAGLYDYLSDRTAMPLTRALVTSLAPSGRLLIPHLTYFRDTAYLEAVMDWFVLHRNEGDLRRLLAEVPEHRIGSIACHRDPTESITFLELHTA